MLYLPIELEEGFLERLLHVAVLVLAQFGKNASEFSGGKLRNLFASMAIEYTENRSGLSARQLNLFCEVSILHRTAPALHLASTPTAELVRARVCLFLRDRSVQVSTHNENWRL